MADLHGARYGLRFVAGLLPVLLSTGCHEPLALQDPFFAQGGAAAAAAQTAETERTLRYLQALQAARQACFGSGPPAAGAKGGPGRAATSGRAALARLCEDMPTPSTAAEGGVSNAYRRWVEDRTRKLPEATATGADAAGGS